MGKVFFDTDKEIEKKWGKSIPQIVDEEGWAGFRNKESEICKELEEKQNAIIATGGGVVLDQKNMECLKKNKVCIFLKTDVELLAQRIENSTSKRPSLTGKNIVEELQQIWKERRKLYEKEADIIIENTKSSKKNAERIFRILLERQKKVKKTCFLKDKSI